MKSKLDFKETVTNLKKAWIFARNQKKALLLYFISSFLLSIISAIIPVLTAKQILMISDNMFDQLITISIAIFAIEILRNVFRYFSLRIGQIFFRETLLVLQYELAYQTLCLETEEIDNNSSGIFIDRINKDSVDIADIFSHINYSLSDILTNIGILVTIFIINKWAFIYFVIALCILYIFKRIRMEKYFELDKEYRKLNEKNTGLITELIRGIRDIKVLNANTVFIDKMKERLSDSNQKRYQMNSVNRFFNFIAGSIQDVLTLLFIFVCIYLIQDNMLSISSFVILYMYQSRVYNLLDYIASLIETLKNFNVSSKRVFEIIGSEKYKKEIFGTKHLSRINGDFEFRNVNFSYKQDMPVIKNVSFNIKANETVAFVGKSGSGKTTIFNLLTKLYHANSGEILIDGNNIEELDQYSLRSNISIITQAPYIFNFSIRDNLKIVRNDISDEEMYDACKLACFHEFVMSLPDKYDTLVGEGGVTLSGGQRQRLAIARALLKKSEIIFFDEATSALDNETQKNIKQALDNMKNDYTILIIAHRLSTVINSHRIILIDDGKIISAGSHKELLKNCDLYKQLYNSELLTTTE